MIVRWIKGNRFLLFLIIAVILSGGALVIVGQEVYKKEKLIQATNREIHQTEWSLKSLRAELAFLTRPDRIEALSQSLLSDISPAVGQIEHMSWIENNDDKSISFDDQDTPSTTSSHVVLPRTKPVRVSNVSPSEAISKETDKKQTSFSNLLNQIGGDE